MNQTRRVPAIGPFAEDKQVKVRKVGDKFTKHCPSHGGLLTQHRMNLRHAAVLALVGWYLMTPPAHSVQLSGGGVAWIKSPPLTKWTIQGSFDKATECTDQRNRLTSSAIEDSKTSSEGRAEWMMAKCIATDDPRLKRN